ncbi:MAG: N-acetylglucosamine-6-phosphate deacetylase [Sediminibacterium sp.]|jgi:N-acetylglucosamine-6-phosphate deacetylase|uniref:N-acetylglucosamine-6-phosphate deacetylase n=1 Tax=Sediminibacterium sp. TaxID=1917865 RepID=UPI003F70A31D
MAERNTYYANRLFTGSKWLNQYVVVTERGAIIDILPATAIHEPYTAQFSLMAPAFMDIQIYGAYDRLLAVYPEVTSLERLYEYCKKGGAAYFQPTVATNSYEVFKKCIDAVRAYKQMGGKGCIGLHVEGPWINPLKRGAHQEQYIHAPTLEQARELLEYGKGVITMITLAPEVCSQEVLSMIRSYGIVISAGHSNATYEESMLAFKNGIGAATHLFNAMSPLHHREPGLAGAILDHETVMCSVVPDGYHVDFAAIRIAKKQMKERLFAITDAVTNTTTGPYPHALKGDYYESDGVLSGSALNMVKCVQNLVHKANIQLEEAFRMASLYPAQVMGLAHRSGRIEKGYNTALTGLSETLDVIEVVDGP